MNKIGVSKLFWDAFELALTTKTKQLARDIADSLGVDATPLLKSLTSETVGVYLFDEAQQDGECIEMRCSHYTPLPGKPTYVAACMEPVVYSANPAIKHTTCLHHALYPNPRDPTWSLLTLLVYDAVLYYIDKTCGNAYNANGKLCGRYVPTKGLIIFEVNSPASNI
jgi:hypothetical protein